MGHCWPLSMPPTAKSVLVSLADNANDHGHCWPSIDTICTRTCFGRDAVIDAISWLESAGAVKANRENGRKTTYMITPASFNEGYSRPSRRTVARVRNGLATDQMQSGKPTGRANPPVGQNLEPVGQNDGHQSGKTIKPVGQNDTNRQEPSINRQRTINARASIEDADLMQAFQAFYAAYPRKVARAAALKAWLKLKPDVTLQTRILGAVAFQRKSKDWLDDKKFVPHPATYLNHARWEDEVPGMPTMAAAADGPTWLQSAGFFSLAEAMNARCHVGNAHEFKDGMRVVEGVVA
jgi:hypothetical protein